MTVELVYGPVGSGKSYTQLARGVSKIHAHMNNSVVANFSIKFTEKESKKGISKRWHFVSDSEMNPRELIRLSLVNGWYTREGSCLLLIDEAGASFNSRDWQSKDRVLWLKFLAHSRKFGYDVAFICQSPVQVDKQIRESVEFKVKVVNLKSYVWFFWLPKKVFLLVKFWTAGNFRGTSSMSMFFRRTARRYDTAAVFDPEIQKIMSDFAK